MKTTLLLSLTSILLLFAACKDCDEDCPVSRTSFFFEIVDENGNNLVENGTYSLDTLLLSNNFSDEIVIRNIGDNLQWNLFEEQTTYLLYLNYQDIDTLEVSYQLEDVDCCGETIPIIEDFSLQHNGALICTACDSAGVILLEK
jgi:hypothetical protein